MEVILAKSAGFCFGVRRAVNEVYRCLEEEKDTPIYTFGPIIHNDEVVNDLKNKGVQVVDTLESLAALKKGIVIIRSHGVGRDTETKMRELGMRVIDMTCPFVKKIHRLVEEKSKEGYQIVIAGHRRPQRVDNFAAYHISYKLAVFHYDTLIYSDILFDQIEPELMPRF